MKVELLAPAGSVENFQAALNGGADAVYVGAPGFNARNPAKELQLEEIYILLERCRQLGKKLYIAANSLLLEQELGDVLRCLSVFEQLQPDALIVQDYGLVRLVQKYFPSLALHGSTLMTVHNSEGVRFLGGQGFERVVVARELTVKEIATIARKRGEVELEIFIHGAMCFSYSGLCLFSSYLGGKSGLRGKCVQPCRRAYTMGKGKGGAGQYLFSMNDLVGLDVVGELVRLGISSLKIEGRLRSAHYVETVVRAYRLVLDALDENGCETADYPAALEEAKRLEALAMSRKTTSGYFFSPQPIEAISPHQSGNMGIHLGRFSAVKKGGGKNICRFSLKEELRNGDRLRLHLEPSGERRAFRLDGLFVGGELRECARRGERVSLSLPDDFTTPTSGHVEVFKTDGPAMSCQREGLLSFPQARQAVAAYRKRIQPEIVSLTQELGECTSQVFATGEKQTSLPGKRGRESMRSKMGMEWWLRLDSLHLLDYRFPFAPDRYLLAFEKTLLHQAGQIKRRLGRRSRTVIWALPPVFMENDLARISRQIEVLLRTGFRSFQLAHPSQLQLFSGEKVHLFGDYTLNIMNSQTMQMYMELGLAASQVSIELDRENLANLLAARFRKISGKKMPLGLCVYGAPPLYTARLHSLPLGRELLSPRQEPYVVEKKEGITQTRPSRPFSLLPYVEELKALGLGYLVVDSCGCTKKRELEELSERLAGTGRYGKLPTFNYLGKLY